ncbi:class I SAM-dependent methyltransferase [Legionella gresilensis]|uniref:class I SAM-dependent methyltransferase n=1 Tax=Legionella gresilensis TaxID=91823 RepID=UPI0010414590|nr:class I SAM-dependent methyltransferase [Legionella gresilensis]
MSKYNIPLDLVHIKILKKIKPESMVLEFGPAHGIMTQYMKEQLNCRVFAVELNTQAAADAKQFCEKIFVGNIEEYQWRVEFNELKFDYIIFADVLEHLYNPWQVLSEVKPFLKNDGRILVSIPNIANNAIIMNLINDKFEYRPTGLLDDTHIRFFTKSSIDNMIKTSGYKAIDIDAIFKRPSYTEFQRSYLEFNQGVVNSLSRKPNGHVYQYIYEIVDENSSLNEYQIDDLKEPLTIEVFYDTGKNFNQEERLSISGHGKHTIKLPNVKMNQLRIDPSSRPGILQNSIVKVVDSHGVIYDCKITNLIGFNYLSEQQSICFGNDPQIIIDLPINNPAELILDITYQEIYLSQEIFTDHEPHYFYNETRKQFLTDMNNIQSDLANKKQELECIKKELQHAKQELQLVQIELQK